MKINLLFTIIVFISYSCNDAQSLHKKANEFERAEDYHTAIQYLNKAIKKDPSYIDAYLDRGVDKHYIEDYEGAIEDYTKVINIDSTICLAYYNRAKNYNRMGDHKLAFVDIDKAEKLIPMIRIEYKQENPFFTIQNDSEKYLVDHEEIAYERGITYFKTDSLKLAVNEFNKCRHYFEDADEWLSTIYLKMGDTIAASNYITTKQN